MIGAVLAVASMPAVAGYDTELLAVSTNNVQPSAAVHERVVIPCGKQKDVAVHIEFSMNAADTSAQTFVFARSVTGATNDVESLAAKWTVVGIAATGNTRSVTVTNIPTYGAGSLIYIYSTNAAATAVRTNTIIKFGEKTDAP